MDLGQEHDTGQIQIYVPVQLFCVVSMRSFYCVPLFEEELTENSSPDILKLLAAL